MTDTPTGVDESLEAAFPDRAVEDVSAAGPSWNHQNETVRVEFADGDAAYLKVAADGDGTRVARERAVVDYVGAHCDVAVPAVVASDPAADPPFLATAPMDARNLADGWWDRDETGRAAALRDVGAALAAVHARTFERHGQVAGGGAAGLELDAGTWAEVLADRVAAARNRAQTDRFDHHFDAARSVVREHRDRLNEVPASLVHGDPAHPNVFRGDGGVGFVDWELAHVGDPARELVRAEKQLTPEDDAGLVSALHEGYRREAGSLPDGLDARRPVYDVVWHVNLTSVFEQMAAAADEPESTVAAEHEAEMDRLLDAVR